MDQRAFGRTKPDEALAPVAAYFIVSI